MVKQNFDKEIRFRITKELEQKVKAAAKAKDKPVSDYLRQVLREYLAVDEMENRKDAIQSYVAKAVEEKLKPVENRLAKINAKTAHAAAISMYLEAAMLQDLGRRDVAEAFNIARNKALAFVREEIPNTAQLANWAKNAAGEKD